jgi:hypothetical protein
MVADGQRWALDKEYRSINGPSGSTWRCSWSPRVCSSRWATRASPGDPPSLAVGISNCTRMPPLCPLTRGARNSLVLRFPEHGRERRPEDCCQLSRWKLLIYEAQRLDEGNGVHDVAKQSHRPPGIVRGELQEPHVEEAPPQGGPLARWQRPALLPELRQSFALHGHADHAVAGAGLDEAALVPSNTCRGPAVCEGANPSGMWPCSAWVTSKLAP